MAALLIIGIILLIAGAGLIVWSQILKKQDDPQNAAARSWPEAPAHVVNAWVEPLSSAPGAPPMGFEPRIHYRYQLGGRDYDGYRIAFADLRGPDHHQAGARLAAYPIGSWIRIRYNPAQPEESVAEVRSSSVNMILIIGMVLVGLGTLLLVIAAIMGGGSNGDHDYDSHHRRRYRPRRH